MTLPPLRRADLEPDLLGQLRRWADESGGLTVGALTTVGAQGQPRTRIVPIRAIPAGSVEFHTVLAGPKGDDIEARADQACMLVWWPDSMRQVRIDGSLEVAGDAECDAAFAARPRGAQVRAWLQRGIGVVPDRGALEAHAREVQDRFATGLVPRPPGWAVVRLHARSGEVFQAAGDACHDRFAYALEAAGWQISRLAP